MLAHRGLALTVPENTLAAFDAAVTAGATHLETDVHATRDGVAVLVHDAEVVHQGVRIPVAELTLAELRSIDLGGGERVPTVAEALAALPEGRFNIDIKEPRAVYPTADAVQNAGAVDRVLITSFSERRRRGAVQLLPGVATSSSSARFVAALAASKARITPGVRAALRGMDAVQIPERYSGIQVVTSRSVAMFHAVGVEVHVWTVNDPAAMSRLLALGVDGLVTDRTDIAVSVIKGTAPSG
ncbi:glycerophosphodiester phosphodiesterase family protein [Homoserinimonas sp. OAct 916]|uniref:glycerophosphodiester phosphodiesterase family protein n=1 Tax=Homoserinimonas sp. OAct 916 TaxID=2211450 RepID=UPI001E399163|nr:glycerophosphodiester phosphodiesterase family protein [Homoserinimonas sp. OAct 916]